MIKRVSKLSINNSQTIHSPEYDSRLKLLVIAVFFITECIQEKYLVREDGTKRSLKTSR